MKLTKKQIDEIVNSDNDLIGAEHYPTNGSNLDTAASNTTDNNTGKGHQPFKYDMLARFGFGLLPFFEGEEKGNDELLNNLSKFLLEKRKKTIQEYIKNPKKLRIDLLKIRDDNGFCIKTAQEILDFIKPYIEKSLDELNSNLRENIEEYAFIEGKVLEKKDEPNDIAKEKSKDNDVLDKKIQKIADLLNKMDIQNISKLKNLLEDE